MHTVNTKAQLYDVDEAQAILSQIQAAMAEGREALWRLAEALHAFEEVRGWKRLGYENLSQWLAEPDISMTTGTYNRLCHTWRKLVVQRKIDPERVRQLDQSKVAIVTEAIVKGRDAEGKRVTIDEALSDAEAMGARDLRERYYGKIANVGDSHDGDDLASTAEADLARLRLPAIPRPSRRSRRSTDGLLARACRGANLRKPSGAAPHFHESSAQPCRRS